MIRLPAQRILKVEYEFPSHVKVSRECRDLLSKILVPDPTKRITIPEIQRHPWYLKDLPPGVAEMNDSLPQPSAGVQARPLVKPWQGRTCARIGAVERMWLRQGTRCCSLALLRWRFF